MQVAKRRVELWPRDFNRDRTREQNLLTLREHMTVNNWFCFCNILNEQLTTSHYYRSVHFTVRQAKLTILLSPAEVIMYFLF